MSERTPEQIEVAKARMAKVRAGKGAKKKSFLASGHRSVDPVQLDEKDGPVFAVPKKWTEPNEFEGLTDHHCCDNCKQFCCVITQVDFCGHPKMGGLQSKHMMNPDLVARFNRAKKYLQHRRIDIRKDP